MADVRVMSWNLRTFGVHSTPVDIDSMADVIVHEDADIVCVQEIQIGTGIPNRINHAIAPAIMAKVNALHATLDNRQPANTWAFQVTGTNRGIPTNGGMRDAYAFFYKTTPQTTGRFSSIVLNAGPIISPPSGQSWGPGRRAGLIQFNLSDHPASATNTLLDIYSIHAATNRPTTPNAAQAIRYMTTLAGGPSPNPFAPPTAVPAIPTLVVGDFNYDANTVPVGGGPYANLITNYVMGIPGNALVPVGTTYTWVNPPKLPAPISPVNKTKNLYDNIFYLSPAMQPAPPPGSLRITAVANATEYDFISPMMAILVAGGLTSTAAFWQLYKGQYFPRGVSDHLPVRIDIQF